MELKDKISSLREYYQEKVKPHFENKNLSKATMHMTNLFMELDSLGPQILPYHSSLRCAAEAEAILYDHLRKDRLPPQKVVKEFEAYLAQLNLSTISANRG